MLNVKPAAQGDTCTLIERPALRLSHAAQQHTFNWPDGHRSKPCSVSPARCGRLSKTAGAVVTLVSSTPAPGSTSGRLRT